MLKHLTLPAWFLKMGRNDSDSLLALIIAARNLQEDRVSFATAFRAGLKVGRKYPDVADKLLGQEVEWHI